MAEANSNDNTALTYCSFCRRSHRDVGPLVEGPDQVYICIHCVRLCGYIMKEEAARRGVELPPEDPEIS
jgi:ATP-dependent Clp protease ATP-binding subunit ClpX